MFDQKDALAVAQHIVESHSIITHVQIVSHLVGRNWREINFTPAMQREKLMDSLASSKDRILFDLSRQEFLKKGIKPLPPLPHHHVFSLNSRVRCSDGTSHHIPMMNFHMERDLTWEEVEKAVRYITSDQPGFLLRSGRFLHYYGNFLLEEKEWPEFMGKFLMPCILVSPRYIGHCLQRGYCSLRLTTDQEFKPCFPAVIAEW